MIEAMQCHGCTTTSTYKWPATEYMYMLPSVLAVVVSV